MFVCPYLFRHFPAAASIEDLRSSIGSSPNIRQRVTLRKKAPSFIEIRHNSLYRSEDKLEQLKDGEEKEIRPFSAMDRVSSCFNLHTEDYEAYPERKRYVSSEKSLTFSPTSMVRENVHSSYCSGHHCAAKLYLSLSLSLPPSLPQSQPVCGLETVESLPGTPEPTSPVFPDLPIEMEDGGLRSPSRASDDGGVRSPSRVSDYSTTSSTSSEASGEEEGATIE